MARETPYQAKNVIKSRDTLLECARIAKKNLQNSIDASDRDRNWTAVQAYLDQYRDYQTAADILGYGGTVESP